MPNQDLIIDPWTSKPGALTKRDLDRVLCADTLVPLFFSYPKWPRFVTFFPPFPVRPSGLSLTFHCLGRFFLSELQGKPIVLSATL
jgi:hypothetical protein